MRRDDLVAHDLPSVSSCDGILSRPFSQLRPSIPAHFQFKASLPCKFSQHINGFQKAAKELGAHSFTGPARAHARARAYPYACACAYACACVCACALDPRYRPITQTPQNVTL